ncbi:Niemann-Pick C1, N-terminal [Phytophthora cactorum]|nr:Niemann-Pick C1, N-terminal [Phytophthora cactorum]
MTLSPPPSGAASDSFSAHRGQVRDDADVRESGQRAGLRRVYPRGQGQCVNSACVCRKDGMAAGPHCDQFIIQCPAYKDSACCSWQQNQAMAENFKLLASVFAQNSAGGCDACAANLMSLWCGLVCSPDRISSCTWLTSGRVLTTAGSHDGQGEGKVLELNVALAKEMTCAIFDSCKNTAMASMAAAMKSSLGFLTTRCRSGNPPDPGSTAGSIASKSTDDKQCPCGACRATCDTHTSGGSHIHVVDDPISVFSGFNTKIVAAAYGLLVILAFSWSRWKNH